MRAAVLLAVILPVSQPASGQDFRVPDSIVASGIRRGIYPGAVLVIGRSAGIIHARGFGHRTWQPQSPVPSPDSTLWDLASLTKVVATTPAVMRLVEDHRVDLAAPVARYLPRFSGEGKERVTVRQLLDHTSGLPSYVEFFRLADTRDSATTLLYRTPLRRPPGTAVEYSDLNFMLLGLLVETVTGETLDRFVSRAVLDPAAMHDTRYRPGTAAERHTAPTGQWRGRPVCCHVNDQNAARLAGVAGHAGLFSTGVDLARYARLWLGEGTVDGHRVFEAATVRTFLSLETANPTRVLGWERPDPAHRDDSAYGHLLSPRAFGHTGWTGTLLWLDPERDLFLILLTNRSFGPRVGHSIRALRAVRGALADAVIRTLGA
ncbi:MAG TPA: serine hydrolase domain-containing protein [Gemmatimonadales bacterium]|jgi:CubicO group peptidase (beta-lactamase class C family)